MTGPEQTDASRLAIDGTSAQGRSIEIHGDNTGIVSTGDYAFNVVYTEGGFAETQSVMELPLREPPALPFRTPVKLFGRDVIVGQVTDKLTGGESVQLYGLDGVGKKSIVWEVHRRLAAEGVRGHVLLPQGDEEQSLEALYRRLAGVFFGKSFLRGIDESMLRNAVSEVDAHITLVDSTLSREDLSRVLVTFSGCTFLVTSQYSTLPASDTAYHVQPLPRDAAIELLSFELGLPLGPIGLQNLQFQHAYQMAEGKPRLLLLYAEFIKGSDAWRARSVEEPFDRPRPIDPGQLSPENQAQALAVALSEPARQALIALETFATPLTPAWCAAVTGSPQAAEAIAELSDRRLVTWDADGPVRITPEASTAVRAEGWDRSDPSTAAEGILALLTEDSAPPPEPQLFIAVTRALERDRQRATLVRFVKTTAPLALRAGDGSTAVQLYILGRKAAEFSGMSAEAQYYARTGTLMRAVMQGDRIAVAAALTALAAEAAGGTTTAGAPTAGSGHHVVGHGTRSGHKISSWVQRALKLAQAKPAVAVAVSLAVVGATAGVVVAASGSASYAEPGGCAQLSNIQLMALNVDTDWVNEGSYGQNRAQIDSLQSQINTLIESSAAAAKDPQIKSTLQKLQTDNQAFTTAYDAGGWYAEDYENPSSEAALKAEDDGINSDLIRLTPLCTAKT